MLKRHRSKMKQYALLPIPPNSASLVNVCNLLCKMPVLVPSKELLSMCSISYELSVDSESWRRVQDSTTVLLCTTRMKTCGDCTELPDSWLPGGKPLQPDTVAEFTGNVLHRLWSKTPRQWHEWLRDPEWCQLLSKHRVQTLPDIDLAKKEHSKNIRKCSHCMYFSADVKPF